MSTNALDQKLLQNGTTRAAQRTFQIISFPLEGISDDWIPMPQPDHRQRRLCRQIPNVLPTGWGIPRNSAEERRRLRDHQSALPVPASLRTGNALAQTQRLLGWTASPTTSPVAAVVQVEVPWRAGRLGPAFLVR